MAQPTSVSLSKFTASVQAAVKAAVAKHPKFKVQPPHELTISYLIRGIPAPDTILSQVTVGEAQAFADDVAAHIAGEHPDLFKGAEATRRAGCYSIRRRPSHSGNSTGPQNGSTRGIRIRSCLNFARAPSRGWTNAEFSESSGTIKSGRCCSTWNSLCRLHPTCWRWPHR